MNENLDLTKILEGCPIGTKFYSTIFGNVSLKEIVLDCKYPIIMSEGIITIPITKEGKYILDYEGECTLFPDKNQRDWSKFERFWDKPKVEKFNQMTLKPFDKVLARYTESEWMPTLFGFFIDADNKDPFSPFVLGERVVCVDIGYQECIPYNDDTKHLVGTLNDCPEYYKWWEK